MFYLKFHILISFIFFNFYLTGIAQIKIKLQGSATLPTGYFVDAVDVGFGGTANFSYTLSNTNWEISSTTGFLKCGFREDLPDYKFSYNAIPLLLGIRFNFTDYDFIPYIGVEAGIYIVKYKIEIDYNVFGKLTAITNDAQWGISPEIGFRMNLTTQFDIDVNAKYNRLKTKYIARAFLLIQSGFAYRF